MAESADWLFDVDNKMDTEDGVIWFYAVGAEKVMGHRLRNRESDRIPCNV
jgi:hypothetical protein